MARNRVAANDLLIVTDPRLVGIPKFLETPKDESLDLDRTNLAILRRLAVPRIS